MKNRILALLIALLSISPHIKASQPILDAMQDEMNRSLRELKIENLNTPYYIEYYLNFSNTHNIKAQLGAITNDNQSKTARLTVKVRVGDYTFDNTNFLDFSSFFFGSDDDEERFSGRQVPYEADYSSLRRELWLATDAAYKAAVEEYAKKTAIIKNKLVKDTTPDFVKMKAERFIDTNSTVPYNHSRFMEMCKEISGKYIGTNAYSSQLSFEYAPSRVYYLNSEGREYIQDNSFSGIEITSFTQAADGMPIYDFYSAYAINPNDLPKSDSLLKANSKIINNLADLSASRNLDDAYSGPILFTSQAAGELMAQVFVPNLIAQRQMLTEQGKQSSDRYAAFQNKIGGRVLPEFMSVQALPEMEKYNNVPLYGYYKYDEQGVKAQKVDLVKDGYLKTLLSSRVPTKRIQESNGHSRGGGAIASNILLTSDKAHSKTYKELKDKMMKLCKDRALPYGIVVKKVMNPNIFMTGIYGLTNGLITPRFNKMMPPVEAYKIYPDGKEELIRGVEIGNMTAQSFKDIIFTGKDYTVMNFLMPSVVQGMGFFGSRYMPASVIVPDLLFEDAELKPNDEDFPKLPFIAKP